MHDGLTRLSAGSGRVFHEARHFGEYTMNAQPNLGMHVTTFENPMGIDGFEFVEFAAPAGRAGAPARHPGQ